MKIFAVVTTTLLRDAEFLNITDFSTSTHTSEIPENLRRSSLLLILQSVSPMCIATPKELNNKHTYDSELNIHYF